ncbi:ubiquitin carboxyl-terminal hydrolase 8, partial [Tremellales sp. Uapishka_1]
PHASSINHEQRPPTPTLPDPHLPSPAKPQPSDPSGPKPLPATKPIPPPKPALPPIPHSPPSHNLASRLRSHAPDDALPTPATREPTDDLAQFQNAFPSLSEFGKQFESDQPTRSYPFDGLPDGTKSPAFPHVPTFSLPSVPTARPGLASPPTRPNGLSNGHGEKDRPPRAPSPPIQEINYDIRRPASTPMLSDVDKLSISPVGDTPSSALDERFAALQPRLSRSQPMPKDGPELNDSAVIPTLTFPVPRLAAPPAAPKPAHAGDKPKFPITNSIEPDTLRSYFINPAVDILLLDVREESAFQRGYVGQEYEARGAKVKVVWMDPTVIMREGMTSAKLEDALYLSSDAQRRAFQERNLADVVVMYDSSSHGFPDLAHPNPISTLFKLIYEHEFEKKLPRPPVLLTGGYRAWVEFIKKRQRKHEENHAGRPYNPKGANGYASTVPIGPRPTGRPNGHVNGTSLDLTTKKANRDVPVYQASHYAKNITDSFGYGPQSMTGESSYTSRPHLSTKPSNYSSQSIAPPPQASINPSRRNDHLEQHNQSYSGSIPRPSIDYPQTHALQPPPTALDKHDFRPGVVRSGSVRGLDVAAMVGDDVRYWGDVALGLTGLKNLGNTCYMNSTLQCLNGRYKASINVTNPLGTKGNLAHAFAELIGALWQEDYTFLSPITFRKSIITFAQQFSGTDQHDSQEFLSFVLDGLHEDLNRVRIKPPPVEMTPEREAALENLPPEVASEKEWQIYRMRNDSLIVDLFQGQYRNRLECLTCHKTSTTYDAFMYMSLPVPSNKSRVVLQELIDEFVQAEIMQNEDAWNCPRCKVPRRASKTLTISRLPPVLLIQLKRFSTKNGVFWDKSETPVIFPVNALDLSRYVPPRAATGREDLDDPRTQIAPYKYDLYGVSNHMGTLSSGHYTAFVKSSKGWMYCEDSKITKAHERDVVRPGPPFQLGTEVSGSVPSEGVVPIPPLGGFVGVPSGLQSSDGNFDF